MNQQQGIHKKQTLKHTSTGWIEENVTMGDGFVTAWVRENKASYLANHFWIGECTRPFKNPNICVPMGRGMMCISDKSGQLFEYSDCEISRTTKEKEIEFSIATNGGQGHVLSKYTKTTGSIVFESGWPKDHRGNTKAILFSEDGSFCFGTFLETMPHGKVLSVGSDGISTSCDKWKYGNKIGPMVSTTRPVQKRPERSSQGQSARSSTPTAPPKHKNFGPTDTYLNDYSGAAFDGGTTHALPNYSRAAFDRTGSNPPTYAIVQPRPEQHDERIEERKRTIKTMLDTAMTDLAQTRLNTEQEELGAVGGSLGGAQAKHHHNVPAELSNSRQTKESHRERKRGNKKQQSHESSLG